MDVRSTEELVAHGVSLFSAGDLAGAARVWLRALEQAPGERRAVGYLKHLKKVAPEILSLAEREVSVDLAKHIQLSMPPIEVESGERELVLRSNTTQSFTIPKVQPAVVDDAPQPRAEPVEPAVPQGPQTPYAGRGHFPDKEPSLASDNLSPAPPVSAPTPSKAASSEVSGLNERLESLQQCLRADDLSGALVLANELEAIAPKHPMVLAARQHCVPKLEAMWLSELGGDSGVLKVGVASHELLKSNLDAMSGFLLSQVDGRTPVSQLLQLSGQPRFDALEALYRLKSKGLIELSS